MKGKRMIAGWMIFVLTGALLFSSNISSAEASEAILDKKQSASDLKTPVVIQISSDQQETEENLIKEPVFKTHADTEESPYGIYTNDYFYNRLSGNEQLLYNRLYVICDDLLRGEDDAEVLTLDDEETKEAVQYTLTKPAQYSGMTAEEAKELAWIFQNNNPQFYYLGLVQVITETEDGGLIQIGVLSEFANGAERKAATEEMFSAVDSMRQKVMSQKTDAAKIKAAHDMICLNTVYDNEDPDKDMNQNAYSVFVDKKSVCAGYSEAFAMLLNSVGIDAICITRAGDELNPKDDPSHEYNAVRSNGIWRLYDVTWDDLDNENEYTETIIENPEDPEADPQVIRTYKTGFNYDYYGITPEKAESYGENSKIHHTPDSFYNKYLPDMSVKTESGDKTDAAPLFRLYNPNSGEHFYTLSEAESTMLAGIGWAEEGVLANTKKTSEIPVYRLGNPTNGGHHYTVSRAERWMLIGAGWNDEGIGWYSSVEGTPVYRLYNPNDDGAGSHTYTTNEAEKDFLTEAGWIYEGIGWYGI